MQREDGCLALKVTYREYECKNSSVKYLFLLTLLEFIYRFTSKNRIQPELGNFSGAATCCCGSYRGTNLFMQRLLCRLMKLPVFY